MLSTTSAKKQIPGSKLPNDIEQRFKEAAGQLARVVRKQHKFYGNFLYWKCRLDPAYQQCLEEIPGDASVSDIGGGLGGLCLLHESLHHSGSEKHVIDWDERKIDCGRAVSETLSYDITYRRQDAYSGEAFPKADAVCLIDVLHYKPIAQQNKLLDAAVAAVNPGGKILIRDMDAASEKTGFTKFQEKLALFFSLTKAKDIYPRQAQDVKEHLEQAGFEVSIMPSTRGRVFANVLIIGKAPLSDGPHQ